MITVPSRILYRMHRAISDIIAPMSGLINHKLRTWNRYLLIVILIPAVLLCTNCRQPEKFSSADIETGSLVLPPDQEFEIVEYSTVVIEKSIARPGLVQNFVDADSDGIPDGVNDGKIQIRGNINVDNARGYIYSNHRYVVFYPADVNAGPKPGESKLLGFLHYFDDYFLDITLAVVIKQKDNDPAKTGTQVAFIDAGGNRTGNPAYAFYPRADVESLPSYQRWPDSGQDYAFAADPGQDAFIILLKDLGFQDEFLIVAFKWF